MKIAGIDEAGKGPVIGPMVVAGVMVSENRLPSLEQLGVRDSKATSPKRRKFLAEEIERIAECYSLNVSAEQIDELRKVMNMNYVMVVCYAKVLHRLNPDMAFLDAADVIPIRFAQNVREKCDKPIKIISEHNADAKYPIVSAASIIAKVRRDAAIRVLESEIGQEIGSGYPSDARTQRFLDGWIKKHNSLPPFVRHSWKTAQAAMKKHASSLL
ncbi:MAG: ribonuclease HII [Methanosarcinales archaeon Met12]|nr:MAG: ribonuclease HII [Methanosarcinales archaeon Met12]